MTVAQLEEDRTKREDRRDAHLDRVRTAAAIVAVVLLAALVWYVWDADDTVKDAVTQTQSLAQSVQAACEAGGAAKRELDSIGACDDAEEVARDADAVLEAPAPVVEVATDEQVRAAVADYLERNPPADGRTPTQAEVDAAVARYCEANVCRGADGTDGTNGTNGTDGTDGADGANATDDQVRSAVAEYCSTNNGCLPTQGEIQAAVAAYCQQNPGVCTGPQGAEGPPGPVLPEYYTTRPGALPGTMVTLRCLLRADPPDVEAPPHYDCEEVTE